MSKLENVETAVNVLKQGGIILYKTDTIWGLGCDSMNVDAINRIYNIKNRSHDKPFICLVDSVDMLLKYIDGIHPRIETLLGLHKRPLTVVYHNPVGIPDILLGADNSVAIRITHNEENKKLINSLGVPLIATSANFSGKSFPSSLEDVSSRLIEQIDYTLLSEDMHANSEPSTMVKFTKKGDLIFIRD